MKTASYFLLLSSCLRAPLIGVAALAVTISLTGCGSSGGGSSDEPDPVASTNTLYEAIQDDQQFSILVEALEAAELTDVFIDEAQRLTVFAPTDVAFTNYLNEQGISKEDLLAADNLADILLYHTLEAVVDRSDALAFDGQYIATGLDRNSVIIDDLDGTVLVNNATVIEADSLTVDNGIVHVIDTVLEPPADLITTLDRHGFAILSDALEQELANLSLPTGDVTLFAPSDMAFTTYMVNQGLTDGNGNADPEQLFMADALPDLLRNHLLADSPIGGATASFAAAQDFLTTAVGDHFAISTTETVLTIGGFVDTISVNIPYDGGIIHTVDVVIPSADDVTTVFETIADRPTFEILEEAIIAAGLDDDLDTVGAEYTVFGPTDSAFNAYFSASGTSKAEFLASNDLADVLSYHVLPIVLTEADALTFDGDNRRNELRTVHGKKIILDDLNDLTLWVNDTAISAPYRDADNGIVHYIDGVLLPPMDLLDTLEARGLSVLAEAMSQELSANRLTLPDRPNTVLAPTDAAFTALLNDLSLTKEQFLADISLAAVLADHVIDERSVASAVAALDGQTVTTAAGESYPVSLANSIIGIGPEAVVTVRNVPYNGGVLHIIDAVLIDSFESELNTVLNN